MDYEGMKLMLVLFIVAIVLGVVSGMIEEGSTDVNRR